MPEKKPGKPNLDLISMVQNARMMHDAEAQPSQVSAVYWIEVKSTAEHTLAPTPRAGEWRIPTTLDDVDALWEKIKSATAAGKLGYKSKVSTKPANHQTDVRARLICVRTANADDVADVQRVEAALRELGISGAMHYQRDTD